MTGFHRAHPGQRKLWVRMSRGASKIRDISNSKPQGKDRRVSSSTLSLYVLVVGIDSQEKSACIDGTFTKPSPGSVQRCLAQFPGSMIALTFTAQAPHCSPRL